MSDDMVSTFTRADGTRPQVTFTFDGGSFSEPMRVESEMMAWEVSQATFLTFRDRPEGETVTIRMRPDDDPRPDARAEARAAHRALVSIGPRHGPRIDETLPDGITWENVHDVLRRAVDELEAKERHRDRLDDEIEQDTEFVARLRRFVR